MTDRTGQQINVGSWVAYATRVGNSAEMKIGMVKKITPKNTLQILGVNFDGWWDDKEEVWKDGLSLNQRAGNVQSPKNVVVLPDHAVFRKIHKLYHD